MIIWYNIEYTNEYTCNLFYQISAAVCFLLSPAAAFISGETLKVDGAASLYAVNGWEIPGMIGCVCPIL